MKGKVRKEALTVMFGALCLTIRTTSSSTQVSGSGLVGEPFICMALSGKAT